MPNGRNVHFNLKLDKGRTDGSFMETSWWWQDDTGHWQALPSLYPNDPSQSDAVRLQANDTVTVAIGEYIPDATTAVSSITLAVVFGSKPGTVEPNSPFYDGQNKLQCLFIGNTAPSGGLVECFQPPDDNGRRYLAWVMNLGQVKAPPQGTVTRFELMVGANVTLNDGTTMSFGHDPEVDVGMGS